MEIVLCPCASQRSIFILLFWSCQLELDLFLPTIHGMSKVILPFMTTIADKMHKSRSARDLHLGVACKALGIKTKQQLAWHFFKFRQFLLWIWPPVVNFVMQAKVGTCVQGCTFRRLAVL